MRIFLSVLLFDMIFRSCSVLYPWRRWAEELQMETMPRRLATAAECKDLGQQATPDNPHPVRDRTLESLTSLRRFLAPWPTPQTHTHLDNPSAWGKYSLVWMTSRLSLFEHVVGFNNEWPMFSPDVADIKTVARARLVYADGSERIVRSHADPVDLNAYSHWNEDKILNHELKVRWERSRKEECFGWCNWLAHRHPRNADGFLLVKIQLFEVTYRLAPPGCDASSWYKEQMRLTPDHVPSTPPGPDEKARWQTGPAFYEYDPAAREGRML